MYKVVEVCPHEKVVCFPSSFQLIGLSVALVIQFICFLFFLSLPPKYFVNLKTQNIVSAPNVDPQNVLSTVDLEVKVPA